MAMALSSGGKRRSTRASTNAGLLFTCGRVSMIQPMQSPSPASAGNAYSHEINKAGKRSGKRDGGSDGAPVLAAGRIPRKESQEKDARCLFSCYKELYDNGLSTIAS